MKLQAWINFFFFREVVGWLFHKIKKGEREQLLSNIEKLIVGLGHHFIHFNDMYEKYILLSKIVVRICEYGEGD